MNYLPTALLIFALFCLLACGNPAMPGAPSSLNQAPGSAPGNSPASVAYDMLEWMTMSSQLSVDHHMSGNANPIYTSVRSDRFFWTKTGQGFPWDIQLYDDHYIYLWVTELDWSNDHTYKVFHSPDPALGDYNLALAPRVVTGAAGAGPAMLGSVKVHDSTYEIHTDCQTYTRHTLKQVINEVWGPYTETLGGDLPPNLQTLVISYRYNCDSTYAQCGDKEEFHVAKPYGLVKWQHQSLQADGAYAPPDNLTYLNRVVPGQARVVTACF